MAEQDRARVVMAVVVAGALGQSAAALSGVLPVAALPVTVLLLVAAARVALRAPASRVPVLRQVGSGLALVAVLLALPHLAAGGPAQLRGTLGPLLVAVQLAQALTWGARRDLQLGLLVSGALLVLAASYAPDLVAGLPLLAGWVACVVAVCLLVHAGDRERVDAVADAEGGRADRVVVWPAAALALIAGLVAFLVVPLPQDSALQSRLAEAAGSEEAEASARPRTFTSDEVDTSLRGDLSDRPLADVPDDAPALWRDRAFSTWDGRTWSAPGSRRARVRGTGPYRLLDAPVARTDGVRLRTGAGTLWAPGRVVELDLDGPLATDGDGALATRRGVDAYAVSTAAQDLGGLERDVAGDTDPVWLQLPPRTTARTRQLAERITAPARTQAQAVRAVEKWLEANLQYRLDSPVPGRGEDAVDRFLFEDRIGFCEHFATAEVVLLRAVGIPARFVTGLAYGVDAGGGVRTYREKDLHAWVEVSYARAGWVASDPTAGVAQAQAAEQGLRQRLAALLRDALEAVVGLPGGRVTVVALLVVLVLLGWSGRRRAMRRAVTAEQAPSSLPPDDGSALGAFLRLDARLATARRLPSESLEEMAARLRLSGERAQAFATVQQECYGPERPDPRAAVEVLELWDAPAPD